MNEPQHTFLLQDDNSPEHNPTRFREVESVQQSSLSTRQPACKQQFNTHATQQDGRCVVKPPTKEDHKPFEFSHLSAERKVHFMERRRDQPLKDQ